MSDNRELDKYDESENKDPIEYYDTSPDFELEKHSIPQITDRFINNQLSFLNQMLMSNLLAQKERERAKMLADAMIDAQRGKINLIKSEQAMRDENLIKELNAHYDSLCENALRELEVEKFNTKGKTLIKLFRVMREMNSSINNNSYLDVSSKKLLLDAITKLFNETVANIQDDKLAKKYGLG